MRSRYTAYLLGEVAYLMASTDPAGPHWRPDPARWATELRDYCARARFLGLDVQDTGFADGLPTVSFEAKLLLDGVPQVIQERSRFRQLAGRWTYVDAI